MIVDQAEADVEMVQDPFLEAGISIPLERPYQDKDPQKENEENLKSSQVNVDNKEDKLINHLQPTIEISKDL